MDQLDACRVVHVGCMEDAMVHGILRSTTYGMIANKECRSALGPGRLMRSRSSRSGDLLGLS